MSSHIELHAANIIGPAKNKIAVFSCTTTDLVDTLTQSLGADAFATGPFVTLMADGGDIYFYFSSQGDATPAGTVSSGVAEDGTQAYLLKNGEERSYRIQQDANGYKSKIYHLGTAACQLRVFISSALTSNDDGNPTQ